MGKSFATIIITILVLGITGCGILDDAESDQFRLTADAIYYKGTTIVMFSQLGYGVRSFNQSGHVGGIYHDIKVYDIVWGSSRSASRYKVLDNTSGKIYVYP